MMCRTTWFVRLYFNWGYDVKRRCPLTVRELQVVLLIRQDKKYREIAECLGLGCETVKTYAARIRKKLKLTSKLAMALWAQQWLQQEDQK